MEEQLQELVYSFKRGLSNILDETRLRDSPIALLPSQARHHSDDSGVDDLNNRRVGLTQALLSKLQRLSGFVDEVTEELEPLSPRVSDDEDQEERKRMVVVLGPLGTEQRSGITETRFDRAESVVYSRSSSASSAFCQFHRNLRVEAVPLKDTPKPRVAVCVRPQDNKQRLRARPTNYFGIPQSESSTEPLSSQESSPTSSSLSSDDDDETYEVRKRGRGSHVTRSKTLPFGHVTNKPSSSSRPNHSESPLNAKATAPQQYSSLHSINQYASNKSDIDSDQTYYSPLESPLNNSTPFPDAASTAHASHKTTDKCKEYESLSEDPLKMITQPSSISASKPISSKVLNYSEESDSDLSMSNRRPSGLISVLKDLQRLPSTSPGPNSKDKSPSSSSTRKSHGGAGSSSRSGSQATGTGSVKRPNSLTKYNFNSVVRVERLSPELVSHCLRKLRPSPVPLDVDEEPEQKELCEPDPTSELDEIGFHSEACDFDSKVEDVPSDYAQDFDTDAIFDDHLDVQPDETNEQQVENAADVLSSSPIPPSDLANQSDNDDADIESTESEIEAETKINQSPKASSQTHKPSPQSKDSQSSSSPPHSQNLTPSQSGRRNLKLSRYKKTPLSSSQANKPTSKPKRKLDFPVYTLSSDSDFDLTPLSQSQPVSSSLTHSQTVSSTGRTPRKKILKCSDDDETKVKLEFENENESGAKNVLDTVKKVLAAVTSSKKGEDKVEGGRGESSSPLVKGKSVSPGRKGKEKVIDETRVPEMIECAACGKGIRWKKKKKPRVHQRLQVLVCEKCHRTFSKGSFDVVDGYEQYCTLCGDGGDIIICDYCDKSFCESCITRVSGKDHLDYLLSSEEVKFECYMCNCSPLASKQEECKHVLTLLKPSNLAPQKYEVAASSDTDTDLPSWQKVSSDHGQSDTEEDIISKRKILSEIVAEPFVTEAGLELAKKIKAAQSGEAKSSSSPAKKTKDDSSDGRVKEKGPDKAKIPEVIDCAACGNGIKWAKKAIHAHQRLDVLICEKCHTTVSHGIYSVVDGSEEYCTLCGDGGDLLMCDFCDKSFCQACIARVSGKDHLDYLLSSEDVQFTCYMCDHTPLESKRRECKDFCDHLRREKKSKKKMKGGHSSKKVVKSKEFVSDSESETSRASSAIRKRGTESSDTDGAGGKGDLGTRFGRASSSGTSGKERGGKKSTSSSSKDGKGSSSKSSDRQSQQRGENQRGRENKSSPLHPGGGGGDSSDESSDDDGDGRSSPEISTDEISVSDASILGDGLQNKQEKKKKDKKKTIEETLVTKSTSKLSTKSSAKSKSGPKNKRLSRLYSGILAQEDEDSDFEDSDQIKSSQKKMRTKRFLSTTSNATSGSDSSKASSSKPAKKRVKKSQLAEELSSGAESGDDRGSPSRLTVPVDDDGCAMSGDDLGFDDANKYSDSSVKYRTPVKASRRNGSSSDSDLELSKSKSSKKSMKRKRALFSSSSLSSNDANRENRDEEEEPKVYKTRGRKKKMLKLNQFGSSDDDFEDEDLSLRGPRLNRRHVKRSLLSSDSSSGDERSGDEGGKGRKKGNKRRGSENDFTSPEKPTTPGRRRKKIRKLISDANLADETKMAQKEETERKKRLEERAKAGGEFSEMERLVLEHDPDTKEIKIEVRESLVRHIKPHQRQGIKFLYNSCVETLERVKSGQASGCILAHCMGLGKTLQVIALIDALIGSEECDVSRVLVLCPVNVIHNWKNEFKHWIPYVDCDYNIYVLTESSTQQRLRTLRRWYHNGGVLLMGYQMYRNLASCKRIKKKKDREDFELFLLDPGADMVVCDEGHVMRNSKSNLSLILNRIKTRMRIVLTGTPLQNNLLEYYTMVNFVKPNLLGTLKEFTNRFVNPITNGQCRDSMPIDIRKMKLRAHILHETLKDTVQRRDYRVLAECLPPKHEFVLSVKLSPVQDELYRHFLEHERSNRDQRDLFTTFSSLSKVWNHPHVLKLSEIRECERAERQMWMNGEDEDDTLGGFIVFGSDDEEEEEESSNGGRKTRKIKRKGSSGDSNTSSRSSSMAPSSTSRSNTPAASKDKEDYIIISSGSEDERKRDPEFIPPQVIKTEDGSVMVVERGSGAGAQNGVVLMKKEKTPPPWYAPFLPEDSLDKPDQSGKLIFLMELLKEAEKLKEKVLVFTQSLLTLDLIEEFLGKPENGDWTPGLDYYRLDGSIKADRRTSNMTAFNDRKNDRVRLYLISTKAGSLGVNLVAANRVVIFDACWNPSHDLQAIFRTYRYGQTKPIFVYRLLAQGTMEEKIYDRQVLKQSLSMRVVDEKQIGRHYNAADLAELFTYTPADPPEKPYKRPEGDVVLSRVLDQMQPKWIIDYHEHDSLLEHIFDEELSEEDRKAAWEKYKEEMAEQSRRYNYEALQNKLDADQRAANTAMLASLQQQAALQQQSLAGPSSATQQVMSVGSQQVMYIQQNLSMCIQQTKILHSLQTRRITLEKKYPGALPEFVQFEVQSLKKGIHDGYSKLASSIQSVNKLIEDFNLSPASKVPFFAELIRIKSRELHDELERYKQSTSQIGPSAGAIQLSTPRSVSQVVPPKQQQNSQAVHVKSSSS